MSSVADAVVARLREAGVRFLFGIPGGGSNLDLVAAAARARLPFVLTATETAGAIAAVAQSEITGRPGACLTTLGPGVASVVNGVACASLERAPLLVFTDAPAPESRFAHQRLDHRALLAPVTKWSTALTPDNAEAAIEEAIARATERPRGPVHIDWQNTVVSRKSEAKGQVVSRESLVSGESTAESSPTTDSRLTDDWRLTDDSRLTDDLRLTGDLRLTDNLRLATDDWRLTDDLRLATDDCVRPILLIGLHARDASVSSAIRALCQSRRVPAMVTYKAKGVVADTDPWFAGVFTNGDIERPLVAAADLIVTVGLDPVELLPRPWTFPQRVVRIDPDQVRDGSDVFRRSSWDRDEVLRLVARQRDAVCVRTEALAPHRVVQIAAEIARDARVTVDAGAHMFPATMLWPVDAPNRMLISNGLSTMGFALPAAIGAALLDRGSDGSSGERPVVALTGDGGLLMCAGDLVTAARERLRIIVVVFNDAALSLIDIKQKQRQLDRSGVDIGTVDWRALAESVGICAHRAANDGELADALGQAMRHHGPTLVDARVDPTGYPAILKAVRG